MSNEKQLIRWEKHYSDGSVEYTNEEGTKNFEDNLSSVGGLIASRSYLQMKPVEWHERKAENLPISDVVGSFTMQDLMDHYIKTEGFDFTSKVIDVLNSMVK